MRMTGCQVPDVSSSAGAAAAAGGAKPCQQRLGLEDRGFPLSKREHCMPSPLPPRDLSCRAAGKEAACGPWLRSGMTT